MTPSLAVLLLQFIVAGPVSAATPTPTATPTATPTLGVRAGRVRIPGIRG